MLLVKVPVINALGRTKGCEKAPNKIIEELKEIFSNEKGIKPEFLIQEIKVNNSNLEESYTKIQKESEKLFKNQEKQKEKIVFIGGDHSLSYSLVKSFMKTSKSCGLIVFDAHTDCMKPMQEPTHEEWLRAIIEKGFDSRNISLIALRNIEPEEKAFLDKTKANIFSMKELQEDLEDSCDRIMEIVRKCDKVYVSIDIDAIDPAFAPGTGYIEPGGLTSRQFLYILQRLMLLDNIKVIDLVEVNPEKDLNGLTLKLAAKIIGELN